MAISQKYGKINIEGVPDNEPVFVVRAQDALGIPVLIEYARQRLNINTEFNKDEFKKIVVSFADWSPTKLPT